MYNDISFKTFSKKYWYIYLILTTFLVLPPIVFLCCFGENRYDAGAWGSLLAGISTYLGAAFLGVFVFYNTWTQQRVAENMNRVTLNIRCISDHNGETYVPYNLGYVLNKKYNNEVSLSKASHNGFIRFSITNVNDRIICEIEFDSVYYSNGSGIIEEKEYELYTNQTRREPIDYKESYDGFIGGGPNGFSFDYYKKQSKVDYYLIFKVSSLKQDQYYLIVNYILQRKPDWHCAYISEKEYSKRIKEFGNPIQKKKGHYEFQIQNSTISD
jgi:hypothetical protein